mmetsp:Transcript_77742/g.137063  ORF Transcript_77742/g.137063 Transcript_77742/m.137063 type:complete len:232 (+) Transcript_77742:567-1262(+)
MSHLAKHLHSVHTATDVPPAMGDLTNADGSSESSLHFFECDYCHCPLLRPPHSLMHFPLVNCHTAKQTWNDLQELLVLRELLLQHSHNSMGIQSCDLGLQVASGVTALVSILLQNVDQAREDEDVEGRVRVFIVALKNTDQRHSNVMVLFREERNEGLQGTACRKNDVRVVGVGLHRQEVVVQCLPINQLTVCDGGLCKSLKCVASEGDHIGCTVLLLQRLQDELQHTAVL